MSIKKVWYSWFLLLLVLLSVAYYIWQNLGEIVHYKFAFNWTCLATTFVILAVAYSAGLFIWFRLTSFLGIHAPFITAGKAWSLSILGKYVFGKVPVLLIRLNAYKGYSKKKVTVATGVEYIISITSALLLVLISLIVSPVQVLSHLRIWALILLIFMLLALWPPILKRFINKVFKLLRKEPIDELPTFGMILRFVAASVIIGLLHGLGLFVVLNAFEDVSFRYYLTITGTYYAAGLIGMLAVFAPSGIGVREGVLLLALPIFIAKPTVIVGALTIRIISTLTEIFLALGWVAADKLWGATATPGRDT